MFNAWTNCATTSQVGAKAAALATHDIIKVEPNELTVLLKRKVRDESEPIARAPSGASAAAPEGVRTVLVEKKLQLGTPVAPPKSKRRRTKKAEKCTPRFWMMC